MGTSMGRLLKQVVRPVAGVILLAVATVPSLECFFGAGMSTMPHSCCPAMHGACPDTALQASCCDSTEDLSLAPAKPTVAPAPVAVLVAILPMAEVPPFIDSRTWDFETSSPSPPGVPTYLFVSSFRV